jgi:hypothetical protein
VALVQLEQPGSTGGTTHAIGEKLAAHMLVAPAATTLEATV